jgi:hypothetical protein
VTLAILPWSIPVFEGMSIKRPGPDHFGFHVENLDAFKARVAEVAGMNPYLAGVPLGGSPESEVRKALFRGSGERQMADVRSRRELDRHHRRVTHEQRSHDSREGPIRHGRRLAPALHRGRPRPRGAVSARRVAGLVGRRVPP